MKLKETNIFLNKKIKSLETKKNINNSIESKSESKSLNNHTMNDISDILKIGSDKYLIGNSKKNYKLISNNHSAINNNINHKKLLINKNITLSTINSIKEEKNSHIFRNRAKLKLKKKNNMNESVSYYYKVDESLLNNNIRNDISKTDRNSKGDKIEKVKIPVNITNNNYNVQKNNVLINLDNAIIEKLKIQKKLAEYHKIIDKKINNLKKDKAKKENQINRKYSLKKRPLENLNSYRNSRIMRKLDKSYFNSLEQDKMNISYKNSKRDSSYNFQKKTKY